jgi:SIR2-like domain
METAAPVDLATRCVEIVSALKGGRLVPFLGAGINMCGRTPPRFVPGETLPNGTELAEYLAKRFGYPQGSNLDLARVAQFAYSKQSGPLYAALGEIFREHYKPTALHRLFARVHPDIRLMVTTNYDDLMERALDEANEAIPAGGAKRPYDIVWYEAEGQYRGRFIHRPWNETPRPIETPNAYHGFELAKRPVVLKIHGAIDRITPAGDRPRDSFVIAEDQYIDYLLRSGSSAFLPSDLGEEIGDCHVLFVGYGLKDWNMRVLLRRVWQESRLSWPSWAVQRDIDPVERELWKGRNVALVGAELDHFTRILEERI